MKIFQKKLISVFLAMSAALMLIPALSASANGPVYSGNIYPTSITLSDFNTTTVGQYFTLTATLHYPGEVTGSSNPDAYNNMISVQVQNNDGRSNADPDLVDTAVYDYTFNTVTIKLFARHSGNCTVYVKSFMSPGIYAGINVTIKSAQFTVSFNANGGTGSMANQTVEGGIPQTLSRNTFSRSDYHFDGWATSANGSVQYSDGQSIEITSNVTLYAKWVLYIPDTGVTLNHTAISLLVGNTDQLSATVAPSNTTNTAVTWSTSNSSVVKVSANGNPATVTAVGVGTATVTVQTVSGYTATCNYTVYAPMPTQVTMNQSSPLTISVGQTRTISASITFTAPPTKETIAALIWDSSDSSIVSASGLSFNYTNNVATVSITGKSVGTTAVVLYFSGGYVVTPCIINVVA